MSRAIKNHRLLIRTMSRLFTAFILLVTTHAYAQPEATMYTLSGVPQHVNYNPAFVPNYKFVLGIGPSSMHGHYSNSSFSYSDLAVKRGDSLVADLVRFNSALNKKNYITAGGDVEVFRLGIKFGKHLYFNWTLGSKAFARQMIPKDLTSLFINGNAGFINGTASFSPQVETTSYLEAAWGASYVVSNKLTVGAKLKILRGLVNVNTQSAEMRLSVSDDYSMTLIGDVFARTSGVQNIDNAEFKDFMKNKGLALDLGATYQLTDKISLGASLLDIGAINWQNDTYAYRMDPAQARYTFSGVDLQKILDGDDTYFDAQMDSIESKFELQEGASGSYRTPLPGKMYLNGSYKWEKQITFGALLFMEKFQGRLHPGLSVSAHKEFWRIAGLSLSYTAINGGFGNLGAGFNLNLTPFQFYMVGDNLLRMPVSYMANGGSYEKFAGNLRYFNVRAGVNIVLGRDRSDEKKGYNSRSK